MNFLCCDTTVSWQDTHGQSDNGIRTEVDKKNYADIENNTNILFCTGIFWVGQMHYGPPKEIFGWAMAHPKYRVAPPMNVLAVEINVTLLAFLTFKRFFVFY
jgi:hypothetical protein